jgi:cobalt/nickel transport system permease protein
MAHLHIPDGVLSWVIWAPALLLALSMLAVSSWALRDRGPQGVAYQGALGALVLAAMALEIPLGPFEYHLTLIGPVGVLLGPWAAFQVMFVTSAMLSFIGHGGLTVIGLNAVILGAGAAAASVVYGALPGRSRPAAMAAGTAAGQAISGLLWLLVMSWGLAARGWAARHPGGAERFGVIAGVALPMWVVGVVIETTVAFGIARFLARVRPDLLPGATTHAAAPLGETA